MTAYFRACCCAVGRTRLPAVVDKQAVGGVKEGVVQTIQRVLPLELPLNLQIQQPKFNKKVFISTLECLS